MTGTRWRRYLRFWGTDIDADVRDELAFHLEMRAREFEAQGMSPDAARRAAGDRFGDVGRIDAALRTHDRVRDRETRRRELLASVAQDVRYAVRTLWRAPGFSAAAILCLALGTGATAAVFSIVNAFLFRPLPVTHPADLVVVASVYGRNATPGDNYYPDYLELRAQHAAFESAVAYTVRPVSLRVGDRSERRIMEAVSENFWTMLGVRPVRGRGFSAEEALQHSPVIVISYRFWREELGGTDDVVGRSVALNGIPVTIVGVAPPDFVGLTTAIRFDGWIPATLLHDLDPSSPDQLSRSSPTNFRVMARLRPGVTVEAAQRASNVLAEALQRQFPAEEPGLRFLVEPELRARPDISVSGFLPRAALVFGILTALVLLIACANVASLMLTRVSGRQTELAVRRALGARRIEVIRQLLTESLVVAGAGAVVGVGVAVAVVHWVTTSMPFVSIVPVALDLDLDWRVLAVTAAAAVGAAILSGLWPAMRASDARIGHALSEGARGAVTGIGRQRFRATLVAAQVAVSFLLLVAAGLFLHSMQRAEQVDLGFRQDHGFMATVDVSLARYDTAHGGHFFRALLRQASDLPGVRAAALADVVPLGPTHNDVDIYADLPTLVQEKGHAQLEVTTVTPRYFEALGIHLMSGRVFTDRDDDAAPPVMVINAAMAARLWPGHEPVGQQVRLSRSGPPVQIVGTVGTVTSFLLGEHPRPMVYLPFAQRYEAEMTLHLLTEGDPQQLAQPWRTGRLTRRECGAVRAHDDGRAPP
jgi:predicted permease